MKITREVPGFLYINETGLMKGRVVLEKNYKFIINPHVKNEPACLFIVQGKLNIEYDSGGSIELVIEQNHLIEEFSMRPDANRLTQLALDCPARFNTLIINEGLLDHDVWHTPAQEDVLAEIQDVITNAYPLN